MDGIIYGLQKSGGLITVWDELISGLVRRDIEVELRLPETLRCAPPGAPALGPRFRDGPVVFHSTYFTRADDSSIPSIVTVHDTIYEDFPGVADALDPHPDPIGAKGVCIEEAAVILVPSRTSKARVLYHYPATEGRLRVVPHGVDHAYRLSPPVRRTTRPYVLHVGGRRLYKNFSTVLLAFRELVRTTPLDLVVVGSEAHPLPDESALIDRISDRVRFVGQVDGIALRGLIDGAAAVVSASLAEGFGLPIVEAAAIGTPVACSNIAAYRETVSRSAVFFDPEDAVSCGQAILDAIDNQVDASLHASAVRERFRWDTAVEAHIGAYCDAVSSR